MIMQHLYGFNFTLITNVLFKFHKTKPQMILLKSADKKKKKKKVN